jgi:F-box/leucine-rich repeat protein 10/11
MSTSISALTAKDVCPLCVGESDPARLSLVGGSEWIECSACTQWYHLLCLTLTPKLAKTINTYHCPSCVDTYGPSTYIRASGRKRSHIDYAAFDRGEVNITQDRHPYASRFDTLLDDASNSSIKSRTPASKKQKTDAVRLIWPSLNTDPNSKFPDIDGAKLTKQWAQKNGILEPVRIPAAHFASLGMELPSGLTVRKVADLLGANAPVQVVDVLTQNLTTPAWTMGAWANYFEKPADERDRILNVISLEISGTPLGDRICRPKFVCDMDWVDMVWPKDLVAKNDFPKARLYCLMSVKDAFTDFHIDFGGTSVFYHLIYGAKIFVFIRPTLTNLKKYEQWCLSSDQSKTFFADLVRECHIVSLAAGDSLIIPSGWIHAVYTPKDSLIIGGNFLTPINIKTQIQLAKLEIRTKVPQKFRYPFFDRVVWYAALYYSDLISTNATNDTNFKSEDVADETKHVLPSLELSGLTDLRDYLLDLVVAAATTSSKSYVKHLNSSLPKEIKRVNNGSQKFLQKFAKQIAQLQSVADNRDYNDNQLPAWVGDFSIALKQK